MKKALRILFSLLLTAIIGYCGYQVLQVQNTYADANELSYVSFKPAAHTATPSAPPTPTPTPTPEPTPTPSTAELAAATPTPEPTPEPTPTPEPIVNDGILELQAQNPDAVGWLTIPHTAIDYPFVRGSDNLTYLDTRFDGKKVSGGSIFMDCWNERDFSDFLTILYGHNLQSGRMFASLKRFAKKKFFDANPYGTILLANASYTLEFFAYMVVAADDAVIYRLTADADFPAEFFAYVQANAKRYRELDLSPSERIVCLSTCGREFRGARTVLLGRLVPIKD